MQHLRSVVVRTAMALAAVLALAACGGGATASPGDGSFGTPPPEATASPTDAPEAITVGPVAAWAGTPVTTVCLTTSQTYPQVPELRLPVKDWVETLLVPVGVTVNGKDGPCDAGLKVTVNIEGRSAKYGESGKRYYTGLARTITVVLSATDRKAIKYTEKLDLAPGEMASTTDPTTPKALVESQSGVVVRSILGGAVKAWGPAVAVQALCVPVQEEPYLAIAFQAGQILLDTSGLRDVAIEDAGPVPDDYPSWRHWAETGEAIEGEGGEPGAGCP